MLFLESGLCCVTVVCFGETSQNTEDHSDEHSDENSVSASTQYNANYILLDLVFH